MRRVKPLVYVVAACGAVALLAFWWADPFLFRAPSDREILQTFEAHKSSFEQLRQLALEDSLIATYFSESNLSGSLGEGRQQLYRKLLSEIWPGLIVTSYRSSVKFIFATGGLSAISGGWLKGLVNISGNPDDWGTLVASLDNPAKLPSDHLYLRKIEQGWFIVVQKTD
jgi:hypothetical protein